MLEQERGRIVECTQQLLDERKADLEKESALASNARTMERKDEEIRSLEAEVRATRRL